jgi:hypothetical protein
LKIWQNLTKKIAKLFKFALEKQKFPEFSQFVCQKITKYYVAVGSYWELAEPIRNKINDLRELDGEHNGTI